MTIHDALEEGRASAREDFALALERVKRRNARILAEREGKPIPTAVIDRLLDEVRGRDSEDIDRHEPAGSRDVSISGDANRHAGTGVNSRP